MTLLHAPPAAAAGGRAVPAADRSAQLRRALGLPAWRLRFPAPLEEQYAEQTAGRRARRLIASAAVGVASVVLTSLDDDALMPEVAPTLRALRWTLVVLTTAMGLLAWRLLRNHDRLAVRVLEAATAALLVAAMAYILVFALHAQGAAEHLQVTQAVLLLLMYNGIVARQTFVLAVPVGVATVVAYAVIAVPPEAQWRVLYQADLRVFVAGLLATLFANHLLDRRERHAHLLLMLDQERRADLDRSADLLREQALHDPLTGLFNRRKLDAELAGAWVDQACVAVIALDVDLFKPYNDAYGHPAGDLCLQQLAAVLRPAAAAAGGLAVRSGGEEFALLLPGVSAAAAGVVADSVCAAVRDLRLPHAGSTVADHVTVSAGVAAVAPGPGTDAAALLRAADAALYAAKRAGRDCWRFAGAAAGPAHPAPAAATAPVEPTTHGTETVERLAALLDGRWRRPRFPRELERSYREATHGGRPWRRSLAAGLGLLVTTGYVWLSRDLFPDVVGRLLHDLLVLDVVLILVLGVLTRWRPGRRTASAVTTVSTILVFVGALGVLAQSSSPLVGHQLTTFFLAPMFLGVVLAVPLWSTVTVSSAICLAAGVLLHPTDPALVPVWNGALLVLLPATGYALIASWSLDRAARRAHLLARLEQARSEVVLANAEELQRLACRDPLTGLTNRRGFETDFTVAQLACAATGAPLAVLILDIDHFKAYNDGYGHPAGDACLQDVAAALLAGADQLNAGALVAPVTVARLGGEEFGVLVPGADLVAAHRAAEALRGAVRALHVEHRWSSSADRLTVSTGIAVATPVTALDGRALLSAADQALYRAKAGGRDRVAV